VTAGKCAVFHPDSVVPWVLLASVYIYRRRMGTCPALKFPRHFVFFSFVDRKAAPPSCLPGASSYERCNAFGHAKNPFQSSARSCLFVRCLRPYGKFVRTGPSAGVGSIVPNCKLASSRRDGRTARLCLTTLWSENV